MIPGSNKKEDLVDLNGSSQPESKQYGCCREADRQIPKKTFFPILILSELIRKDFICKYILKNLDTVQSIKPSTWFLIY